VFLLYTPKRKGDLLNCKNLTFRNKRRQASRRKLRDRACHRRRSKPEPVTAALSLDYRPDEVKKYHLTLKGGCFGMRAKKTLSNRSVGPFSKDRRLLQASIDQRTKIGRLFRTTIADLSNQMGGAPTPAQSLIIHSAALDAGWTRPQPLSA
jgi:hypothetical protein